MTIEMADLTYQLTDIRVGDASASWTSAGFSVADATVTIDRTRISLVGDEGTRGILSIAIDNIDEAIDGLPIHHSTQPQEGQTAHANLVTGIDHLVVMTPDCDRTTLALEAAGLEARRIRTFDVGGVARRQTFFWMGRVILELVGADVPTGGGPAELWGLALTTPDIEATAAALGDRCTPPKDAVQQGRRIATLKTRDLGISTAIAIMSPHRNAPQSP